MCNNAISEFRAINDFPELVEYLGDKLEWPIQTHDFEEMTFDYSAEELGLDAKIAPKFLEIRRLRPLDKDQPWGIFFIRFEESKLPVVALRRLLSKLALKKRSTGNKGDRASWHENDLLLISQTGSQNDKSISFAHFASNPEKTDLPILKVLGWDDDDTGLKIDYVLETLREKLIWPDDPTDSEAWRTQWRNAFTLKNREVIQSSKEMAERLGQLALAVRTRLREVLAIESEEGPIHKLMSVFKENLISDLDTDSFSDMYAQTIAYGLLSARIINPKANTADAAHTQIPITNPFLRDLMETFINIGGRSHSGGVGLDFDELGVNEVVDLLDNTNMEAVLRDFGDRNRKEDPVMHFFEGFLQEYDSKIRKDRGVFYTPQPVVSFIVRSVDEQLRTEFGLEDGLADTTTWGELAARIKDIEIPEGTSPNQAFVQILDPATGTGTFPVEVIDLIYKTMTAKWQAEGHGEKKIDTLWNDYVPEHLLRRLHGYELMMAPYAIAHMKIGLKLYETGYRFERDERARVYLTNALEPAQDFSGTLAFAIPALAQEAEVVNVIKKDQRFTVLIGNPPYASLSSNMTDWARESVNHYLNIQGERIQEKSKRNHLQNDYIKFMRIADVACSRSPLAVFSYITSNSYLDGRTLRGLRWNLMQTYDHIRILNLWGDSNKRNAEPGDKNVFDITEGVAICVATRSGSRDAPSVSYADLQGSRDVKYQELLRDPLNMDWQRIQAAPQDYLFTKVDDSIQREFEGLGPPIDEMFEVSGAGMKSNRDRFATDEDLEALLQRVREFADDRISDDEIRERYDLKDNYAWKLPDVRSKFRSQKVSSEYVVPLSYRPFDNRLVYYHKSIVFNPRIQVMSHLISGPNLAIVTIGQNESRTFNHAFVSRSPVEIKMATHYGASVVIPLYLYPERNYSDLFSQSEGVRSNFTAAANQLFILARNSGRLPHDASTAVMHFVYAILYSPEYRVRYSEPLLMGFPRIPRSASSDLFEKLSALGAELVALHLLDSSYESARWNIPESEAKCPFDISGVEVEGGGTFQVEKVSYSDETVWIDKAKTCGFNGVPEEVWNFHIGGYQVCEKWLKDRQAKGGKNPRPGRVLTDEDIEHYQKIVVSISETIRIMTEIDEVIEAHGGWPGAFIALDT